MLLNIMLIHFFGLLSPGPDFFFVSRTAAASSRRETTLGIVGITIGVIFWLLCSMLGLSVLLYTYPPLQGGIMMAGGGYLCYLGYLLIKVRQNIDPHTMAYSGTLTNRSSAHKVSESWRAIRRGLLVNLSNPKVVIYFSSILSMVLTQIHSIMQMALVTLIIVTETFVYFYAVSLFFSHTKIKHFYLSYSRYFDNFAGIIFGCFGLYLVYSATTFFM